MKLIFTCLLIFIPSNFAKKYEELPPIHGMQALKLTHDTEYKLALLRYFVIKPGFDFTKLRSDLNSTAEVLVSPDKIQDFKVFLDANEIEHETVVEDVGKTIKEHLRQIERRRFKRRIHDDDILDSFPSYGEIVNYLKNLAKTYSNKVKYIKLGKSYENREIAAVKISSGGTNKPSIVIDAGIHAREWISITTALYAIKTLVEDSNNSNIFKNVDIYIIPLLNPDGYEYTQLSDQTRLWRKTRSVNKHSRCRGVDANRNFDFEWGIIGASTDPCSEIYAGPKAFSEPESIALRNFMLSQKNIKVYVSLHSAATSILYSWGTTTVPSSHSKELNCAGTKVRAAIAKVRGTYYEVGNTATLLYPASGGSDDWVFDNVGVDLSYTIELPSTEFSFLAPVSEIRPIGEETFEAIKVFAKYAEVGSCRKL